jgi:hypothetical protein
MTGVNGLTILVVGGAFVVYMSTVHALRCRSGGI